MPADRHLSGIVVNGRTGQPVPGVAVSITPGHASTFTDRSGMFRLATPDSGRIHLRHIGFEPLDQPFNLSAGDRPLLRFALTEALHPVEPIVVTATRSAASAEKISSPVDVVTSADIHDGAAVNVGEVLDLVPGVVTRGYGALGDVRTLSIRGSTASQVLILLDGQRMNTAQSGEVDLSILPLEGVRRIEIVRGGASAQYGADAMGGVVNIITAGEAAEGLRLSASGLIGSFGTRGATVGGTLGREGWSAGLSFRTLHSDGSFTYHPEAGTEAARQNADASAQALTGRGMMRINDAGGIVRATIQMADQRAGDPGMIGLLNTAARKHNTNVIVDGAYEQPVPGHDLRLQAYSHALRFRYKDPLAYVPVNNDSRNNAWGVEVQDRTAPVPWLAVTAGYAFRSDIFAGTSLAAGHTRDLHSLFLQGEITPLGNEREESGWYLSVVPAVRWDGYRDFGDQVSPKVGLAASLGRETKIVLKSNAGLSFRAPTFNDLYWPKDNFSIGNPLLKPERSVDLDAGISVHIDGQPGLQAGVTYFHNAARDLILWQPGARGVWSPGNVGEAEIRGIETEVKTGPIFDALRLGWSYTWLDAKDRSGLPNEDGMQLPYRPEHLHKAIAQVQTGNVHALAELLYMSRRYTTPANTTYLAPFYTGDVSIGYLWQAGEGSVDLLLAVRNVGNEEYQMIEGYPVPGREVRLSATVTVETRTW